MKGLLLTKKPRQSLCPLILLLILSSFVYSALVEAFPIQRDSLANGLVILTTEDHKLPMVEIRAQVRAGSVNDPKGKEGLANLVCRLLVRGTKKRTIEKINAEIELVGGELNEWTDKDNSSINIRVLTKDLDLAVDLLADLLLNPTFPDSEIIKVKKEVVSSIIRSDEEPDEIGHKAFFRLLFPNHPYGHPVIGYPKAIDSITKDDILDFYQRYYAPNNCFIVAVGDFVFKELKEKIENKFRDWQSKKIPELAITDQALPVKPKVKIITKPDVNQAYIFLGFLGLKENAPDLFPSRVMNFILGASALSSRLGISVREKGGLAYDVGSYFERNLYPGAYIFSTQTKTANTQIAIDKILYEIRRMRDSGITKEELEKAKKFYTGNFPLTFDSFSDKVNLIARIERYQLGLDYLNRFNDRIQSLTLKQVNQAAKNHLFPDNYILVIVGNLTEADVKLDNVDWVKEE
uniref:Insulinase family protein n=1 Tax=candidate division WOR-3 bacterium TaxID=2052148 RepID=A0A7C6EEJ7_UNCW3